MQHNFQRAFGGMAMACTLCGELKSPDRSARMVQMIESCPLETTPLENTALDESMPLVLSTPPSGSAAVLSTKPTEAPAVAEPTPTAAPSKPGSWLAGLSSAARKEVAVSRGLLAYFPDALALIARHSVRSNEKHNPGQPVHWSREKSSDHEDCILRHSIAVAVDPDSLDGDVPDIICRAWRALAALQLWAEAKQGGKL